MTSHSRPSGESSPAYRALICITTCQRLGYLRRYLPHFARFTASDSRFSLLVAMDGDEEPTRAFCDQWEVPLLHSDVREGVGISKNRVLERFPDYDYYFFIDDDVELLDGSVFPLHVELSRATGIHHFSLFERGGVRKPTGESMVGGYRLVHGLFGGGCFNFFTGVGLRRVGGWHPAFAEHRRGGHTEHSYRFMHTGLAPAPFNVIEDLSTCCIWHSPPVVTRLHGVAFDDDQIAGYERELLAQALQHVPVQTIAPYHTNAFAPGPARRLASVLDAEERYPLVSAAERRKCRSSFYLGRFNGAVTLRSRAPALIAAAWNWPGNPELKHTFKVALTR